MRTFRMALERALLRRGAVVREAQYLTANLGAFSSFRTVLPVSG